MIGRIPPVLRALVAGGLLSWFVAILLPERVGIRELGTWILLGAPWLVVLAAAVDAARDRRTTPILVALGLLVLGAVALAI